MKKRLIMMVALVIGSCILAEAAEPNTTDETLFANGTVVEATKPSTSNSTQAAIKFLSAVEEAKPSPNSGTHAVIQFRNAADAARSPPFKDKIVRVQAASGNRTEIFTLENVKLTSLLGTEFLTGTAVKYDNDRFSGLEVYLNLRDVLTIVAMTPDQAKKFNEARSNQPQQRINSPQPSYPTPYTPPPGWTPPYPPGGQGPYNNPLQVPYQQPGQNPNTPPQGYNPQPWNNPPPGWWNPQPQGPNMPGNNPQQGGPSGPQQR